MSMQAVWMTHRSMTADPSVKEQKLKAGTVKRIFDFARPYRKYLSVFLFTVVIDAFLVVATPLILHEKTQLAARPCGKEWLFPG